MLKIYIKRQANRTHTNIPSNSRAIFLSVPKQKQSTGECGACEEWHRIRSVKRHFIYNIQSKLICFHRIVFVCHTNGNNPYDILTRPMNVCGRVCGCVCAPVTVCEWKHFGIGKWYLVLVPSSSRDATISDIRIAFVNCVPNTYEPNRLLVTGMWYLLYYFSFPSHASNVNHQFHIPYSYMNTEHSVVQRDSTKYLHYFVFVFVRSHSRIEQNRKKRFCVSESCGIWMNVAKCVQHKSTNDGCAGQSGEQKHNENEWERESTRKNTEK